MKVGDKLYCHTPRNYRCDNDISVGKIYTVMNIDNKKYSQHVELLFYTAVDRFFYQCAKFAHKSFFLRVFFV